MPGTWIGKIPAQAALQRRFSFIEDQTLQENIIIAFRYVYFLILLVNEIELPGAIRYSLHKDLILHTATIVESCTHYCLRVYIDAGIVTSSDVMPYEWDVRNRKTLHRISDEEEIIGASYRKIPERLKRNTPYVVVNKAALKAGILSEELFEKADSLRVKRNKIHLAGLSDVDDFYGKEDTKKAFADAKEIIERIEAKLQELRK